jgi:regulator of protease activity HflC (stomatin/prohibitin superfamily)
MADEQATEGAAVETVSTTTASSAPPPAPAPIQLTQARVPIDETADALATPDANGRLPIVVLPLHALRIRNEFVAAGAIALAVSLFIEFDLALRGALLTLGGVLIVLGVFQSFRVPVPESAQAILLRRGRFQRTLGPGNHFVPPWIIVSHFVSMRETPFDAPAMEIPTRDDVRTNVDILMTFKIVAPERFVFTIAAPDFDQVCQATCQESVRLLIRDKVSDEVLDMGPADAERLRVAISEALDRYGVEIVRVVLTHVQPPAEFVASREARRLASVHRAEEEEQHALELLRQSDREELARLKIGARREAIELEATNEVARLERLETRIRDYPNALQWDVESRRLDVAANLAGNTRAMVQVGPAADVAASLLMHTMPDDGGQPKPAAAPAPAPADGASRSPRASRPKRQAS